MDINCGMELHFAETTNLEETDFVSPGTSLSDKLDLSSNTDAVQHLLVLDQVSPPSRSCTDHDNNDKHLSAADFKLDLGPANDLVSATDFPIENSVADITSDSATEENSEGYSILNAALEGNQEVKQHMAPSRASISTIPSLPLASILPNLPAVQVVPIGNLQQVQLLSPSVRPTNRDTTVAQLLSANQKMNQFPHAGSQPQNNQKIIPLNLYQQGNSQVLGLPNSENQKSPSGQCLSDSSKTVQQLINLQSGSSSAILLGNLLLLQPVTGHIQGNMTLTQPTVNSLTNSNAMYTSNSLGTIQQPPVAASSSENFIHPDRRLPKNVVPRVNFNSTASAITSLASSLCATAVAKEPVQVAASVPGKPCFQGSNDNAEESCHFSSAGKGGNNLETDISSVEKPDQECEKVENSYSSIRKNTKIVINGKTISMTFDCRNNVMSTSSLTGSSRTLTESVGNLEKNITTTPICVSRSLPMSAVSLAQDSRLTTLLSRSAGSSEVKYVSILEPNLASKSTSKMAVPTLQTSPITIPLQAQNKPDMNKFMVNPVKVNLATSTACQIQEEIGQGHFTVNQGQNVISQSLQRSVEDEEAIKSVCLSSESCSSPKDTPLVDASPRPIITGGPRNEYKCDLCSASFNRYGNYTRHRMIHTVNTKDDYRYKCQECGRLFLQRCDMKRHMLIHTNDQPFRCLECGRGYIRRSDLVVHMRFHKKEKTFKCVYCSKNFYQSGDLNRHMRNIHLQTPLLTCGHCSRQFVKKATLIRHMQTRHRDIIIKTLKTISTPGNLENNQEDVSTEDQDVSSDNIIQTDESREDLVGDMDSDDVSKATAPCDMAASTGVLQFKGADLLTSQVEEVDDH